MIARGRGRATPGAEFFDAASADGGCLGPPNGSPVVLATGLNEPVNVALDDGYAYWVDQGMYGGSNKAVKRVPLCGGSVESTGVGSSQPVGSRGRRYSPGLLDERSRQRARRRHPERRQERRDPAPPRDERQPSTPAVLWPWSASFLYWTAADAVNTIGRIPLDGGAPEVVVAGYGLTDGIAVDSTYVYWTIPYYGTGTVERAP